MKRKYEQGGGVVPTDWKRGEVPSSAEFGVVLREVWALAWDWRGVPEVTARIGAYKWDNDEKRWRGIYGEMTGRCVRWLRVGSSRSADLTLTLAEWPNG